MTAILPLLLLLLILTGCSSTGPERPERMAYISPQALRLLPDQPLMLEHRDVLNAYQKYLDISTDDEARIRVLQRMAALTLQQQELHDDAALTDAAPAPVAAIRNYEELLQRYPQRPDNDALRYQLARAYSLAGQPRLAIISLENLLQQHPRSGYRTETHFRLGQLYYSIGDYAQSALAYQQVQLSGRADNRYYVSAGYLRGWALYKQQQYAASLLVFTQLLDTEFPHSSALDQAAGSELDILNDSLRVMAMMFATQDNQDAIAAFYDQHGQRHYEYLLYERLAGHYANLGYHQRAIATWQGFVGRYPLDQRAPEYYRRLIDTCTLAGYTDLRRQHQRLFNQKFGVGSVFWNKYQDPDLRQSLTDILSVYLRELASHHHGRAQQLTRPAEQQSEWLQARRWYEEYWRSFPDATDIAHIRFMLAETAFAAGDYPSAAEHYEWVAYQAQGSGHAAEAGYAAILAYQRYQPAPQQQAEWRQATAASAMRFVTHFQDDARAGGVLVNSAEMLLEDEQYEQALAVATQAETTGLALTARYRYGAALVRGHASFALADFAGAEQALLLALAQQQAAEPLKRELREKIAASIYQQGLASREQGQPELAVHHWRRLATVVPESSIRTAAEYDAATLLMTMADYPQAISVLQQFRQQYPDHPLAADIPAKLILAYEAVQNWSAAAAELQILCEQTGDAQQQRIACYQAARYYQQAGAEEQAILSYRHYAHQYPAPLDVALEAHLQLQQLYASRQDEQRRQFWLNRIIRLHNNAGSEQTDRSRYLAASAAFQLAELERRQFEKIRLTQPLERSITRKKQVLQAAQQRYTQAIQLGVMEFTTAASYQLGQLYAGMSKALMESQRPAGLDELELEEYQFLLEEQAFPFDEAAIAIHQTNAGRSRDGLYDQWIRHSFAALAELMPGQYAKQERVAQYVDPAR